MDKLYRLREMSDKPKEKGDYLAFNNLIALWLRYSSKYSKWMQLTGEPIHIDADFKYFEPLEPVQALTDQQIEDSYKTNIYNSFMDAYIGGANFARRHYSLLLSQKDAEIEGLKSEWVDVKDRLPGKSGFYFAWVTKEPGLIHYHIDTGWQNGFLNDEVTHWRILSPPKAK